MCLNQDRPRCARCHKAKFQCLGYRDLFIDERQPVMRRVNRTKSNHDLYHRNSSVASPLTLAPWKFDIFISYLINNITVHMRVVCQNLAVPNCRSDSAQRTATEECILALATTFFGVGHAQTSLVREGRCLYGRALRRISSTIVNPSNTTTEVMSGVFALSLHEVSRHSILTLLPTTHYRSGN